MGFSKRSTYNKIDTKGMDDVPFALTDAIKTVPHDEKVLVGYSQAQIHAAVKLILSENISHASYCIELTKLRKTDIGLRQIVATTILARPQYSDEHVKWAKQQL